MSPEKIAELKKQAVIDFMGYILQGIYDMVILTDGAGSYWVTYWYDGLDQPFHNGKDTVCYKVVYSYAMFVNSSANYSVQDILGRLAG